jgi:TDG/mug DNA glycosylase family protein
VVNHRANSRGGKLELKLLTLRRQRAYTGAIEGKLLNGRDLSKKGNRKRQGRAKVRRQVPKRYTEQGGHRDMPPLRDIVSPHTRVLFVGINPSLRSAQVGHHFAGQGNPFWRLLYAAQLVSIPLTYEQDQALAAFGMSLTNFCPRATRSASELRPEEFMHGRVRLLRKICRMRPRVVAFVGVSIYRRFFGKAVSVGPGAKPERICDACVFVLPNPSGLNASFPGFNDKLIWFERLKEFAESVDGADAHIFNQPKRL